MKRKYLITLMAWGVIRIALGQWQLIDDFEEYNKDDLFYSAEDIGWQAISTEGNERFWIIENPENSGNLGLQIYGGGVYNTPGHLWCTKELPGGGIAPAETGTLFVRYYAEGYPDDLYLGTTANPLDSERFFPPNLASNEFNAEAVFNLFDNPLPIELKYTNGNHWTQGNPSYEIGIYSWYNIWIVIRNSYDEQGSNGTFSIYAQGPDDLSLKLVTTGESGTETRAAFRSYPVGEDGNPLPIPWIMLCTITWSNFLASSTFDYFVLDDIYFASGENLTNPVFFGGYTVDGNRDTDTGDWLGWLNVNQAPFLWSYALNGWLYMVEPAADMPGAWTYFFK